MHEYGRDQRCYYSYFENAFIFTSSDDSPDILFSLVLHHPRKTSSGGRMRLRVLPALLSTGRESASVQHPF
jgi:hypothetical protein